MSGAFGLFLLGCSSGASNAQVDDLSATGNPGPAQSADAPPTADAGVDAATVRGARVCDESLAIFSTGNKYDVSGSDEVYAKVRSLGSDNVWVVDKTSCRTYFKVNKYLLRVESLANHAGDPVSGSYQCSDAHYWCKQFLHRTGSSDIDAPSATCAIGKDPKCVFILKQLDDSSAWAEHDYSDMTVSDAG